MVSRGYHKSNILHPGITVAIERYERVAALCSIEPRHPLLDKRLVEFSLGLPWEQKVRHGWSKFMLRRVGAGALPEAVVWNRGWGDLLGWPVTRIWMQQYLKHMVKVIKNQQPLLEGYMDSSRVKQVIFHKLNLDRYDDALNFWNCYSLANWLTVNQQR